MIDYVADIAKIVTLDDGEVIFFFFISDNVDCAPILGVRMNTCDGAVDCDIDRHIFFADIFDNEKVHNIVYTLQNKLCEYINAPDEVKLTDDDALYGQIIDGVEHFSDILFQA